MKRSSRGIMMRVTQVTALVHLSLVPVAAQWDKGYTTAECNTMAVNALSNPARVDSLLEVRWCPGKFGPVYGGLLKQTGLASSDLDTWERIVYIASQFSESVVYDSALAVANDGSAPEMARLGALMVLRSLVTEGGWPPDLLTFENYATNAADDGCAAAYKSNTFLNLGEVPPPASATATVLALANSLTPGTAPRSVTFVASCIRGILKPLKPLRGVAPPVRPPFDAEADFVFLKQCGRKFVLRNKAYRPQMTQMFWEVSSLKWNEAHTEQTLMWDEASKWWNMPAREAPAPYSESVWVVPDSGTTALVETASRVSNSFGWVFEAETLLDETPDDTPCP